MLVDLYKLFDIEAYGLTGTRFQNRPIILCADEIVSEEETEKIFGEDQDLDPEELVKVLTKIESRVQNKIEREREALEFLPTGNHAITQVNSKDNTYLLDPTNLEFHAEADENGRFFTNHGKYFKIVNVKKRLHLFKDHLNMEIVDKKPIMELKEMSDRMNKRSKIITDNQDIVEKMYESIEPLLQIAQETYKLILNAR